MPAYKDEWHTVEPASQIDSTAEQEILNAYNHIEEFVSALQVILHAGINVIAKNTIELVFTVSGNDRNFFDRERRKGSDGRHKR